MKKHLKPMALGLCLGLLIFGTGKFFGIQPQTIVLVSILVAVFVVLGACAYNYIYMRKYRERVQHQLRLLEEEHPREALADMEAMWEETKGKNMKRVARLCRLNMTAAYCDLKEYEKALEVLRELSSEKLVGNEDLVYRLNLCACYFYQGREEEGLLSYASDRQVFDCYRKDKTYGGNIAVITMHALLAQDKWTEAAALLEEARKKWDFPRLQDDYRAIEHRLKMHEHALRGEK